MTALMTMDEIQLLRADIAAVHADLTGLRADVDTRLSALRSDMDAHHVRLEAKIDERPGAATLFQNALATFTGTLLALAGMIALLIVIDMAVT